jgi:hypothetical protein
VSPAGTTKKSTNDSTDALCKALAANAMIQELGIAEIQPVPQGQAQEQKQMSPASPT